MGRVVREWVSASDAGHSANPHTLKDAKARQSNKIRELRAALASSGLMALDEQAKALVLCRSTTWMILSVTNIADGLSATTINRMLSAPQLPPLVRATLLEYVEEKIAGTYGHSRTGKRRFSNAVQSVTNDN